MLYITEKYEIANKYCDKVYQLLAHGRWVSPGTPASSTTKTCRHDIAEILLKVALNTKNQTNDDVNYVTQMSTT
jgi:ABC-type glutathione transport system ATPase component